MNPNKAQDVWKDAGEHVQVTVLELKRENQAKEQEAIQEFVERFQAITRSLRIRDNKGNLKVSLGFSNDAWDYLFPNAPKPKELGTYQTLTGPAHLYLWDEPLNYLDTYNQQQLIQLIQEKRPPMLIVEHDQNFIKQIATKKIEI